MAVMRRKLRSQLRKIENCINLAQKMVGWNPIFEIKPVEKPVCGPECSPIIDVSIDSKKIDGITLSHPNQQQVLQQNTP